MAREPKEERLNVSITCEDAATLKKLQIAINAKHMMDLSIPQIVKRLIKQAAAIELQ